MSSTNWDSHHPARWTVLLEAAALVLVSQLILKYVLGRGEGSVYSAVGALVVVAGIAYWQKRRDDQGLSTPIYGPQDCVKCEHDGPIIISETPHPGLGEVTVKWRCGINTCQQLLGIQTRPESESLKSSNEPQGLYAAAWWEGYASGCAVTRGHAHGNHFVITNPYERKERP